MKKITQNLRWLVTLLAMIVCTGAWADDVTDVLDQTVTGVTGTSYKEFTGKVYQNGQSRIVYAGYCAGANSSIQLNSKDSKYGIVTTSNADNQPQNPKRKAKKITVVWNNTTTQGRTLDIYGKNSAYSAASELYNSSTQGTKIGSIVCGTSTELTLSDSYEYIGFRSNNGAMYITSISIVWTSDDIIPTPAAPTISPASGTTFSENLEVSISAATGCSVIYTTDGSEPTSSNGTTYSAPFTISATTTVKAVAKNANNVLSEVASASYTKLASEVTPPYSDLATGLGNFTSDGVQAASTNVWGWDTQNSYAKGTAYINGAYASESWLLSPTINLTNVTGTAVVTFKHARYSGTNLNDAGCGLFVKVAGEDTWTKLEIPTWPTNWTFVESGEIDLEAYVGQKIQLGFKYVSTSSAAGTWEIKNFSVVAKKRNAGLAWSASEASATMGAAFEAPTLANPNSFDVTYSSSDGTVATIDSNGAVTIVGAGTATISAMFEGDDTYEATTVSYELTVSKQDVTLSFSASSFNVDFDDKDSFVEPTLTGIPEGLTVTYASNNTNVAKVDATTGDVTIVGKGTARITASFTATDIYNEASATYTINVEGTYMKANGYYALVTDASTLAAGDEIIIINTDAKVALSTNQKDSNRGQIDITNALGDNVITINNDIETTVGSSTYYVQALTLKASDNGCWLFDTGNGYLYAAHSSKNQLKTEAEADDNAKAKISITNGDATIVFQGSNSRNTLLYNPGTTNGQLFSCYATTQSSMDPVQIYRKVTVVEGTLAAGKYATRIYPFAPKKIEGVKFYTCTAVNGNALALTVIDEPAANTPYILGNETGASIDITQMGVDIHQADTYESESSLLVGTFVNKEITSGYVLQTQNGKQSFYKVGTDNPITVPPYRAYLDYSAEIKALGFDDATAINTLEVLTSGAYEGIYSVDGVKLNHMEKGVNILKMADGTTRKVIVK